MVVSIYVIIGIVLNWTLQFQIWIVQLKFETVNIILFDDGNWKNLCKLYDLYYSHT